MKKVSFFMAMAIVAFGLSFSSCKKDQGDGIITNSEVSAFQDDAQANDMMDDVDNETDDVTNGNSALKSASADTTSLTGRSVVWTNNNDGTKTAVITYTNFQNPHALNERIKNGVISIIVTGKRSDNTYKRVVTFQNFSINGNKIEGTRTIEKTNDLTYKITLTDGKITFADNTFITCSYARTRTMVDGSATPYYIWDDAYTFEGSASGVTRSGVNYSREITSPIKIYTAYRFPVSGSFTLTTDNNTFSLDYGNGTMDALATISKDGDSKVINLRK